MNLPPIEFSATVRRDVSPSRFAVRPTNPYASVPRCSTTYGVVKKRMSAPSRKAKTEAPMFIAV